MSSPFPTPYTVGWHTAAGESAYAGTSSYTPPLNDGSDNAVDGTPVQVMGWAPADSTEPQQARVVHDIDLYVPPGVAVTPQDVVDLPLDRSVGRFEVVGHPDDWTKGPFGFTPGAVVKLKRVEG